MLLTSYAFRSQRSVPRVTARFAGAIVRSMPAKDLGAVLRSPARDTYQIVDVREKSELEMAALPTPGVIHLPMSEAKHWGGKIINAELLDRTRPTICLCHHGMRSMQMASFLVTEADFEEVHNASGGIHAYATQVDPTVPTY